MAKLNCSKLRNCAIAFFSSFFVCFLFLALLSALPCQTTPPRHPHHPRHARVRSQPSLARLSRSGLHRLNGTVHGFERVCQTAKVSPKGRSSNLDWVDAPRSILATPRFTHRSQRTIVRRGHSFNKFLCGDLSQNNQGPFPGDPVSPTLQPPFVAP